VAERPPPPPLRTTTTPSLRGEPHNPMIHAPLSSQPQFSLFPYKLPFAFETMRRSRASHVYCLFVGNGKRRVARTTAAISPKLPLLLFITRCIFFLLFLSLFFFHVAFFFFLSDFTAQCAKKCGYDFSSVRSNKKLVNLVFFSPLSLFHCLISMNNLSRLFRIIRNYSSRSALGLPTKLYSMYIPIILIYIYAYTSISYNINLSICPSRPGLQCHVHRIQEITAVFF